MPVPTAYTDRVVREIYREYAATVDDIIVQSNTVLQAEDVTLDKPFSFNNYPGLADKVTKRLRKLAVKVTTVIERGSAHSWLLAEQANDAVVKALFGDNPPDAISERYLGRNIEALKSYQTQKVNGRTLSDRIWRYVEPMHADMQLAIDSALLDGKPAATLAGEIKPFLKEPERLYRRVRDQRGELHLSKNAANYKPGQGVYRSSYKNAARVTRTKINGAYRMADFERWKKQDFVVGYEIRRSNNTVQCDMCEKLKGKYPKTFMFTGWHPQCKCNMVAIQITSDELDRLTEAILNDEDVTKLGSVNKISAMPKDYLEYVQENRPRLLRAKTAPYFIQDNYKGGTLKGDLQI